MAHVFHELSLSDLCQKCLSRFGDFLLQLLDLSFETNVPLLFGFSFVQKALPFCLLFITVTSSGHLVLLAFTREHNGAFMRRIFFFYIIDGLHDDVDKILDWNGFFSAIFVLDFALITIFCFVHNVIAFLRDFLENL